MVCRCGSVVFKRLEWLDHTRDFIRRNGQSTTKVDNVRHHILFIQLCRNFRHSFQPVDTCDSERARSTTNKYGK